MTKIELAIMNVEWKIESAKKEYETARENIKRNIDSTDCCIAEYISTQAQNMRNAENRIWSLTEQKNMLEAIAKED